MKTTKFIPLAILSLLMLPIGLQAKPDAPGGGKPAEIGGAVDKAKDMKPDAMPPKPHDVDDKADTVKNEVEKKADLEGKKDDQVRKEAGKGSETGQAKRAEHSRKWWKFWSSDKE